MADRVVGLLGSSAEGLQLSRWLRLLPDFRDHVRPLCHPIITGLDFLVLSFVVVVVGGMGSSPGAVLAGFLLGIP